LQSNRYGELLAQVDALLRQRGFTPARPSWRTNRDGLLAWAETAQEVVKVLLAAL
jgi:hypothetical protein